MSREAFDELRDLVTHSATVQSAAVALLKNLADKLSELANHPSPDEIRQLSQEIRSHADELGSAIAMHQSDDGDDDDDEPAPTTRR